MPTFLYLELCGVFARCTTPAPAVDGRYGRENSRAGSGAGRQIVPRNVTNIAPLRQAEQQPRGGIAA